MREAQRKKGDQGGGERSKQSNWEGKGERWFRREELRIERKKKHCIDFGAQRGTMIATKKKGQTNQRIDAVL